MARIERGDPSVAMASYVMCMWLINHAAGLATLIAPQHCQSAHTALRAAGLEQSYGNLASILLRLGHPDRQTAMREELFKRMVFNILSDNTDHHATTASVSTFLTATMT